MTYRVLLKIHVSNLPHCLLLQPQPESTVPGPFTCIAATPPLTASALILLDLFSTWKPPPLLSVTTFRGAVSLGMNSGLLRGTPRLPKPTLVYLPGPSPCTAPVNHPLGYTKDLQAVTPDKLFWAPGTLHVSFFLPRTYFSLRCLVSSHSFFTLGLESAPWVNMTSSCRWKVPLVFSTHSVLFSTHLAPYIRMWLLVVALLLISLLSCSLH